MPDTIDFRAFAPLQATQNKLAERRSYAQHFPSFLECPEVNALETRLAQMDQLGIARQVVTGGGAPLEDLAELTRLQPRFVGIADITATPCMEAVATIRRTADTGLRLIGLYPYREGVPASDRRFYPVYATCCELGLGVVVHASTSLSADHSMTTGHPGALDQVAIDFPELVVVASHGGWPWVADMVAVAMRHPNLFVELSGQRTKYYGAQGSGWEVLMRYARGPLRKKIVWGSTAPFFNLASQVNELKKLPVSQEILDEISYSSPDKILRLCKIE